MGTSIEVTLIAFVPIKLLPHNLQLHQTPRGFNECIPTVTRKHSLGDFCELVGVLLC